MDELQMLRAVLTEPDPSSDVVGRSHHQLQNTMRRPPRRRRPPWAAAALGLTAAAATAAVVIASNVTAPKATPNSPPAAADLSARQILFAAATTAESKPSTSGTYWHVHTVGVSPDGKIRLITGTWTRRDGVNWISREPGQISKLPKREPIRLRDTDLGLDQIQRLPTNPDQLLATLREHNKLRSRPPVSHTIMLLSELISDLPTPPKVRAAAFRALASLPYIQNLGKSENGGYALEFAMEGGGTTLIVDPATATTSAMAFSTMTGRKRSEGSHTTTGEWTDELPPYSIVPLAKQKNYGYECHDEGNTPVCTKVD